jgi:hypothetical protein
MLAMDQEILADHLRKQQSRLVTEHFKNLRR